MTTRTSGLAQFLLARIAEDEAVAQYLARKYRKQFRHTASEAEYWTNPDYSEEGVSLSGERVLAECEAKRRIIEQADEATGDRWAVISEFCVGEEEEQEAEATDPGTLILKALALPYADHPEYRAEWRI